MTVGTRLGVYVARGVNVPTCTSTVAVGVSVGTVTMGVSVGVLGAGVFDGPEVGTDTDPDSISTMPRIVRALEDVMVRDGNGMRFVSGLYVALTVTCTRSIMPEVLFTCTPVSTSPSQVLNEDVPGPWSYEMVIVRDVKKAERFALSFIILQNWYLLEVIPVSGSVSKPIAEA